MPPSPPAAHHHGDARSALAEILTLDDVAAQLRAWRAQAGAPSFTEISLRIAEHRESQGVHPRHRRPGRMTVYDAFSDGRKRLDVQLAVDIARALAVPETTLEAWRAQCVLAQEGRALPHTVTARTGLPSHGEVFVGRDREQALCLSSTTPVVIEGMAGTGKTALGLHAVTALLDRGAIDDVIVVALGDHRSPGDTASGRAIFEAVLRTLGEPVSASIETEEMARTIAEILDARRLALLLDDVADAEQIAALVAVPLDAPVIVTTRTRLEIDGITRIPLSTWSTDETVELLRTVAGRDRVDADLPAATTIAELVDGLPLAASLTAARVRHLPEWTLNDHAAALRERLDAHHLDEPVSASLALTYSALSPTARGALRFLATQPCQSVSPTTVAPLLGVNDAAAVAVVAELDRAHAVLRVQSDRLSLHSLVRAFAVSRSWEEDRPSVREAALDRMSAALIEQSWQCSERLYPGAANGYEREVEVDPALTPEDAAFWLEEEVDSLVELAVYRSRTNPASTVEIAQALSRNFDNRGRWPLALSLHHAAADAARRAGDTAAEAFAELGIGTTSVRLGLPEAATHLERARGLAAITGVRRPGYAATNALAILAAQAGDPRTALARFQESLALAREDGADTLVHRVIDNIAVVLRRLGDLEGALEHHRQSLEHATAQDNRDGIATSLGNMSEVLLLLERVDEAIDTADQARSIASSVNSRMTYGYATTNLGLALHTAGERERGVALVRESLLVARDNSIRSLEISTLNNLGHLLAEEDADEASRSFDEALELGAALEMVDERSRSLHGLARLELARGEHAAAREHLEEALQLLGSEDVSEAVKMRALLREVDALPR